MWLSFLMWVSVMFLHKIDATESEVFSQPDPVMTVSVGDNVTLRCFISERYSGPIFWYKAIPGHKPQAVVILQKFVQNPVFYNPLDSSRFTIEQNVGVCYLKISNIIPSDEAMYYCGWRKYETVFANGTYLALKGSQNNQHKLTTSVLQHPMSASVHPGDSVTLSCYVLSKRTTAEMKMFWFRSDSEISVPQIIYTHNHSDRCEIVSATQNCTYNLSKHIDSQTDTGVYYCAVLTCGKILFGNGTQINMVQPLESIVIILGVLLGVCVVVITTQAVLSHKKENLLQHYYNREAVLQDIDKDRPSGQDCDTMHLHYAAPRFKEGKTRSAKGQEVPQDSVYSQLNNHNVVEYRISE